MFVQSSLGGLWDGFFLCIFFFIQSFQLDSQPFNLGKQMWISCVQASCAKKLWKIKEDAVSQTQPKVCLCDAGTYSYHLLASSLESASNLINFCFHYYFIWWLPILRISKRLFCVYQAVIDLWWTLWSCKVKTDKSINFNCYLNSAVFSFYSRLFSSKVLSAAVFRYYRINPNSTFMYLMSWNYDLSKTIWS